MISRIRIEAIGESAADVERTLTDAAFAATREVVGRSCSVGECHIERDIAEPEGRFAWKGRLILHADVSELTTIESVDGSKHQVRGLEEIRLNGERVDDVAIPSAQRVHGRTLVAEDEARQ